MRITSNKTQNQLKKVASKDDLRPQLQGVYFDGNNILSVTDTFIAIQWGAEIEFIDNETTFPACIIPIEAFPANKKEREAFNLRYIDGNIHAFKGINQVESIYKPIDEKFPDIEYVKPSKKLKSVFTIRLNLDLIKRIAEFSKENNKYELSFFDEHKAVEIRNNDNVSGLIMPLISIDRD